MKAHWIVSTVLVAGLGATANAQTSGGEVLAVFTKNQTNPFFQTFRLGAESAAKQLNAKVTHYIPTKPDSIPEQMSQIEDVIVKKPNAIIYIPVDYNAMVPGIQKMNAAKIPVINATDRSESGEFVSFASFGVSSRDCTSCMRCSFCSTLVSARARARARTGHC